MPMKNPHQFPVGSNDQFFSPVSAPFQSVQPPEEEKSDWNASRVLGILKRRWHIVSAVAILVASYMIGTSLSVNPVYQGRFRLLVEPVNAGNDISELTSGTSQESRNSTLDYDTQIQVLQSPELIEEVMTALRSSYPTLSYGEIVGSLTISQVAKAKLLEVQYQGTNPEQMQAVLEQLAKAYLQYSLSQRQTNLRQGIQFVEEQFPLKQQQVDQLQKRLQAFRQDNYFLDPDTQAQQITEQINAMDQQRTQIDQALTAAEADLALVQDEAGVITTLNQAVGYQQLVSQLRGVEIQIAEEMTRFSPQSLNVRVLEEKRNNLIPLLQQEAQQAVGGKVAGLATQIQALQIQRDAIDQAQRQLYQAFQQFPDLSRRYTDLQRNLQIANESLNRILAARETLQIQAAQSEIPWQVVEPPSVSGGIPSSRVQVLIKAAGVGLAAGLAIAILLEQLANTYQTVEDLKKKVKLPILGQIPFQPSLHDAKGSLSIGRSLLARLSNLVPSPTEPESAAPSTVVELDDSSTPNNSPATIGFSAPNSVYGTSEFVESLRVLYTNLQLRSLEQPVQSVIISSAETGDGKTMIAVQLAQTVAAMGKRVLLVDVDLRRPSVHMQLQLANQQGLFEVITAGLPIREALQSLPHLPLCKVLAAGQVSGEPTQILASKQMQQYMAAFQQTADLVIYDAPPLAGLADASLLAPHADGILFVIGLGKTSRSALTQTLENLKMSQVPILGIVCNSLNA
jgi:polysaccharide biosynthesis transport protein